MQIATLAVIPSETHIRLNLTDLVMQSFFSKLYGSCLRISAISSAFSNHFMEYLTFSFDADVEKFDGPPLITSHDGVDPGIQGMRLGPFRIDSLPFVSGILAAQNPCLSMAAV